MNKLEAIQAMREGKKMTHDYFSPEEWVTMKDGKILLEDGVVCDTDEFWRWRKADNWNEGWRLVDENNKPLVKGAVSNCYADDCLIQSSCSSFKTDRCNKECKLYA